MQIIPASTRNGARRAALLVSVALSTSMGYALAEKCEEHIAKEQPKMRYQAAMDCIFEPASALNWSLRLRYIPSFHTESEILVGTGNHGKYLILQLEAQEPVHALFREQTALDADGVVKLRQIHVKERALVVSKEEFQQWISEFVEAATSFPKQVWLSARAVNLNQTRIILDGTEYDAIYRTGPSEIQIRAQGPETGMAVTSNSTVPAVVGWMAAFKKRTDSLLAGNPGKAETDWEEYRARSQRNADRIRENCLK